MKDYKLERWGDTTILNFPNGYFKPEEIKNNENIEENSL